MFSTCRILFIVSLQVFAVEQFGIQHWKANGETNLKIGFKIKMGLLQPEQLQNVFEQ